MNGFKGISNTRLRETLQLIQRITRRYNVLELLWWRFAAFLLRHRPHLEPALLTTVTLREAHDRNWCPARVTLDGVDVSDRCVTLNEVAGWCTLFDRDENGRPVLDYSDQLNVTTKKRLYTGVVRCEPRYPGWFK